MVGRRDRMQHEMHRSMTLMEYVVWPSDREPQTEPKLPMIPTLVARCCLSGEMRKEPMKRSTEGMGNARRVVAKDT